jgi:glutathione S-transferase
MPRATLTLSSRNYSSWSLRGWLLCRMAGLDFDAVQVDMDDPDNRQELLLLSPTVRVPRLNNQGIEVWDTLAIAEYLEELLPDAGLLPKKLARRAHCRAIAARRRAARRPRRDDPGGRLHAADQRGGRAPSRDRAHGRRRGRLGALVSAHRRAGGGRGDSAAKPGR